MRFSVQKGGGNQVGLSEGSEEVFKCAGALSIMVLIGSYLVMFLFAIAAVWTDPPLSRRFGLMVALFASLGFLAFCVCAFCVNALATDEEVKNKAAKEMK